MSLRKCTGCKERFDKDKMLGFGTGQFHSIDCAMNYANKKTTAATTRRLKRIELDQKKERKALSAKHRADKKRLNRNPRKEALLAAQLLSRVSAADDSGFCECVSCGTVRKWNDMMDGGHFIAKGGCSYWMLDPRNIHPQCKECNGNGMKFGTAAITYTAWMVNEYGQGFIDHMLEMKSKMRKRSVLVYDEFLMSANAEIAKHKKRIGA